MPSEKEKWLEFHDGQYQFKVQFIPYEVFESILKPVDQNYKEKMTQMKKEQKGKTPYTKKLAHMYHLDSVYAARFLMEMFLI